LGVILLNYFIIADFREKEKWFLEIIFKKVRKKEQESWSKNEKKRHNNFFEKIHLRLAFLKKYGIINLRKISASVEEKK